MKLLPFIAAFCLVTAIAGLAGISYMIGADNKRCPDSPTSGKAITKQVTDGRGLTSVVYSDNGQEWAYDYLTKHEYDSIFNPVNNDYLHGRILDLPEELIEGDSSSTLGVRVTKDTAYIFFKN